MRSPFATPPSTRYNRAMTDGSIISVQLPPASYDITVRPGLLREAGALLAKLTPARKAAIITDSHVGSLHLPVLHDSLRSAGFESVVATIPAGEQYKTLATLMPVYDQLLIAKIERGTPILALGGGVVGDMAGFVAATVLRGVPFVQIPTSLLAMVDASVGGKTGVDHTTGKNLIGAFHQPIAVMIDPDVLKTLPPRELRSGLAECIKHDLIRDADAFDRLPSELPAVLALDSAVLAKLIAHNVAIKARVVEADPFEKGERAHLNFGHTFGHAIESVSNFSYAHGEAIALGMCAASFVSAQLGLIDEIARQRIIAAISRAGLPTSGLSLNIDSVIETMFFDKKVKAGRIRFVLLEKIGRAIIRDDVPPEIVRAALESLRG
jgi:3-dehydroquinate synthase